MFLHHHLYWILNSAQNVGSANGFPCVYSCVIYEWQGKQSVSFFSYALARLSGTFVEMCGNFQAVSGMLLSVDSGIVGKDIRFKMGAIGNSNITVCAFSLYSPPED